MPTSPTSKIASQFPETTSLTIHVFPWIETPTGRFLGKGRVELLEKIIEHGSISKAAKEMGMTYKKAWDLISSMNSQSVKPLVLTQTGGGGGGGAVVTEEGKLAIALFTGLRQRLDAFLQEENRRLQAAMLGG
ncbi:MAG: LysR family transcriptional regulator [Saprospiraceae bacterium]|nr:LysR family transcriptional regulator [Saprospiraceae bacterium]